MGSLPLWKGATMRTIRIQNNQWFLEHCSILCIIQFAAPFAHKCDHLSTPHTFLKRPFLTDFKKCTHTPPPKRDEILAHWTKSSQNQGKVPKPTVLVHTECPQDIWHASETNDWAKYASGSWMPNESQTITGVIYFWGLNRGCRDGC